RWGSIITRHSGPVVSTMNRPAAPSSTRGGLRWRSSRRASTRVSSSVPHPIPRFCRMPKRVASSRSGWPSQVARSSSRMRGMRVGSFIRSMLVHRCRRAGHGVVCAYCGGWQKLLVCDGKGVISGSCEHKTTEFVIPGCWWDLRTNEIVGLWWKRTDVGVLRVQTHVFVHAPGGETTRNNKKGPEEQVLWAFLKGSDRHGHTTAGSEEIIT